MNHETVVKFQRGQRDLVSKLGAFISCLNEYSNSIESPGFESNEVVEVRKLQPIVGEFMQEYSRIHQRKSGVTS